MRVFRGLQQRPPLICLFHGILTSETTRISFFGPQARGEMNIFFSAEEEKKIKMGEQRDVFSPASSHGKQRVKSIFICDCFFFFG